MLVAGLVGASGEVVGIERDATSIERAEALVAAAGLRNVSFLNADVNKIVIAQPFDAVVGRFISDVSSRSHFRAAVRFSLGSSWWSARLPRTIMDTDACPR